MTLERGADRVVEYLRGELGDGLRGVILYTPEAAEVTYLRDDLRGRVNLADFERTIDHTRTLDGLLRNVGEMQGGTLGRPEANLAAFEHTLVLALPYEPESGLVVTLERDVVPELSTFAEECARALGGEAAPSEVD